MRSTKARRRRRSSGQRAAPRAYDIVDDGRREDVAAVGYGPRVQLSVFEMPGALPHRAAGAAGGPAGADRPAGGPGADLPTTSQTFSQRYIIGARTVEERSDYWIVR
ncbi:MAG: CRISPR-associated endonuclease Cas2 [Pseudonocardiaceae bacterium]